MASPRLRLGQLLVDARLLTQEALDEVLATQKKDGRRLGALLVERGLINETQLTQILSHQLSVPWVSLLHIEFSRQLLNLVPRDVAERFCLVPIYVRHVRGQGETLYVAMNDPTNEDGLAECHTFSGLPVRAMIAPPSDILNAIRVYYGGGQPKAAPPADVAPPSRPPGESVKARRSERPGRVSRPPPPMADEAPVDGALPAPPLPQMQPPRDADVPAIEAVEIQLSAHAAEKVEGLIAAEERPAERIPKPRGKAPRMVSLTLLDGTTISLPARGKKKAAPPADAPERAPDSRRSDAPGGPADDETGLTARDLVAALRAVAHGADATEILGNARWETLFAALLSLMLKKHLIADWEFVDEYTKI